jgi:hypothetical protein
MSAINEKALYKLANLLKDRALTVEKISKTMKCSKETTRKRLIMLEGFGLKFITTSVRQAVRGPEATAYRLRHNARVPKSFVA